MGAWATAEDADNKSATPPGRHWDEVTARLKHHVSLSEDANAYLDFLEADRRPWVGFLIEQYGQDATWSELARQVAARNNPELTGRLLMSSLVPWKSGHPVLRDLAVANLDYEQVRGTVLNWFGDRPLIIQELSDADRQRVRAAFASQSEDDRERRRKEQTRQTVAIMMGRMSHPVSLAEDVKTYLDFEEANHSPNIWENLIKHYGDDAWPELAKQAAARKPYLVLRVLFTGQHVKHAALRDLALAYLDDDMADRYALQWCVLNREMLSDAQRADVRERLWKKLESKDWGFYLLKEIAEPKDVPRLRALYEKKFRKAEDFDPYDIRMAFSVLWESRTLHGDVLALLARLGEARAVGEIRAALAPKAPPEQRMWGALMAAHLADRTLLPLLTDALNDKRPGHVAICQDMNPEIGDRGAWISAYTRVCDVALRAIYTILPPEKEKPWPFRVSRLRGSAAFFHAFELSEFKYREKVSQGWERLDEHSRSDVVNTRLVVGYTDEQIDFARKYVAARSKESAMVSKPNGVPGR
jgi:hypothetical protein